MPGIIPPTLRDVDAYIKARALAAQPGTPGEAAAARARLAEWEREHPDLPEVAERVEAAMRGETGEPSVGEFGEWFKKQVDAPAPVHPSGPGVPPWLQQLARGVGAGMVAATAALNEEDQGPPLRPGQIDVRIQRNLPRDEIVIRVRLRARDAAKGSSALRTRHAILQFAGTVGTRIAAELDAFLAGS